MKHLMAMTMLAGGIAVADTPVNFGPATDYVTADNLMTVHEVVVNIASGTCGVTISVYDSADGAGNPVWDQENYSGRVTWVYADQASNGRPQYRMSDALLTAPGGTVVLP